MCPNCGYNPDWQAQGLEQPPDNYEGDIFSGTTLTRNDGQKRMLRGCPSCNHVWMDY